jgi:hypothetical protein
MRIFYFWRELLLSVGLAVSIGAPSQARAESCEAALQFDTVSLQQNYLAKLALLNVVNQSNYEETKQNLGASVPGYFTGSFDDFAKKRNDFQQTLSIDQTAQFDSNYYQRVLSPTGAKAFADCMAHKTGAPLVAYIATGQRSSTVAITIRSNAPGTNKIKVSLAAPDYIKILSGDFELAAASAKTVFVQAPLDKPFLVAVNATDGSNGADYTVPPLEMPPYVQVVSNREFASVTGTAVCGAGGFGSTAANYQPTDVYMNAPTGYRMLPDTLRITARRVVGGPGLSRDPIFVWTKQPSGSAEPVVMIGHPTQCDGVSGHTQGHTAYDFAVDSYRDVTRIVKPSSTP